MQHSAPVPSPRTGAAALIALVGALLALVAFVLLKGGGGIALVVLVDPAGASVRLVEPRVAAPEQVATTGSARFSGLPPSTRVRATVAAPGYQQHVVDVTLPARGHEHVVNVRLKREGGLYTVRSEPEGALLYVDGKAAGIAPAVLTDLAPGKHELSGYLEGYEKAALTFEVEPGGRREIVLTLEPLPLPDGGAPSVAEREVPAGYGRVVIESTHTARFFLDNYVLGYGMSTTRDVSPGRHRVAARAEGRGTKWDMVEVVEGQSHTVSFSFEEDPVDKAFDATDPSKPIYWTIRGGSARNEGKYGDGIEHFKKALELDPNDIEAHRQLSRTYPALKQWDEAIKHAERYLELSPAAPDAQFTRELLVKFKELKAAEQ